MAQRIYHIIIISFSMHPDEARQNNTNYSIKYPFWYCNTEVTTAMIFVAVTPYVRLAWSATALQLVFTNLDVEII